MNDTNECLVRQGRVAGCTRSRGTADHRNQKSGKIEPELSKACATQFGRGAVDGQDVIAAPKAQAAMKVGKADQHLAEAKPAPGAAAQTGLALGQGHTECVP